MEGDIGELPVVHLLTEVEGVDLLAVVGEAVERPALGRPDLDRELRPDLS
jgi:hypothetical protein